MPTNTMKALERASGLKAENRWSKEQIAVDLLSRGFSSQETAEAMSLAEFDGVSVDGEALIVDGIHVVAEH